MTPGGLASFAIEGPFQTGGTTFWRAEHGRVRLLFAGRGPEGETAQPVRPEREEVLERIAPGAPPVAWARQIHSNLALPASAGPSGEGDALVASRDAGLALAISTADCVPVLLAGPAHLAAAHAGWRGLASGVIAAAVRALPDPPGSLTAWIGPAIGTCCYEVSPEVAAEVAAGTGVEISEITHRISGRAARSNASPHLDLAAAAELQLRACGVPRIATLRVCTKCDDERLHSYRREGKGGGRNLSFAYVSPAA